MLFETWRADAGIGNTQHKLYCIEVVPTHLLSGHTYQVEFNESAMMANSMPMWTPTLCSLCLE